MNERIRELAKEAGFIDFIVFNRIESKEQVIEKFAELIVQECARVNRKAIESMNKISGKESDNTSFWLEEALKEHFGVEE